MKRTSKSDDCESNGSKEAKYPNQDESDLETTGGSRAIPGRSVANRGIDSDQVVKDRLAKARSRVTPPNESRGGLNPLASTKNRPDSTHSSSAAENHTRPGAYAVNRPATNSRIYRLGRILRERRSSMFNTQSNNVDDAAITQATLVQEPIIADATIAAIIPTAILEDKTFPSPSIKRWKLIALACAVFGIVGSVCVWYVVKPDAGKESEPKPEYGPLHGKPPNPYDKHPKPNGKHPPGEIGPTNNGGKGYQDPVRTETINNLVMTIEGVPFDNIVDDAIWNWETITSDHIKAFYDNNKINLKINVLEAQTNVINTGDGYVVYNQKFKFQHKPDDTTSAKNLAIDPFGSIYDGKTLYITALQQNGNVFEKTSYIRIDITTSSPSEMPPSSHIPSALLSRMPTFSLLPSVSSLYPFIDSWVEITGNEQKVFSDNFYAESDDLVWKVIANKTIGIVKVLKADNFFQDFHGTYNVQYFGTSVTISGNALVLSVVKTGGIDFSDSVWIFQRPTINDYFDLHQQLNETKLSSDFGSTTAISQDGNFLVASVPSNTENYLSQTGSLLLFARYNIDDFFQKKDVIHGGCPYEKLGLYGVAIEANNGALVVHAKGNGCSSNKTVRSYKLECNCKNTEHACSGFDDYPALVCQEKVSYVSPASRI